MLHQDTRARIFDKLIGSLATAERGSRELDVVVSFLLGHTSGETGEMVELLLEEGYSWDLVSELLDDDLPAYTSLLDAAVPGEAIVMAVYSSKRGRWAAAHRAEGGGHVVAWGRTEALARRAAALKALAAEARRKEPQAAAAAPEGNGAEPAEAQRPGERAHEPESGDNGGDWKILF